MNAFLIALLASAVVLVSGRSVNQLDKEQRLKGRILLTPSEETLKILLSTPGGSIGGGNSQVPVGQLQYNFNRDLEQRINPRNPTSDWKWLSVNSKNSNGDNNNKNINAEYIADSGSLIGDGISSAELVSIPFGKFLPQEQGRVGLLTNYEAVLVNKIKFVVEPEHKLTVRAVFSVDTVNVEDQPFGRDAVTNATDDPSLAAGGISLASSGNHGMVFSIVATEKGIWAVYERNRVGLVEHPERDDKIFTIFHRLADRKSCDEEIDAAITYDRSKNLVHFKLNNVIVYTLKNLGTLPVDEVGTLAHTTTRSDLVQVEPKEFTVMVGLQSWLDAQDPNNKAHSLRNQKLTNDPQVYDEKARFTDETGNKSLNLWGQGVALKIHDIVIKLQESKEGEKDLNGRNNNNDKQGVSESDGKLIVESPTADLEEIASITGERVPRINTQGGDDTDDSVSADGESDNSGSYGSSKVRQARHNYKQQTEARNNYQQTEGENVNKYSKHHEQQEEVNKYA